MINEILRFGAFTYIVGFVVFFIIHTYQAFYGEDKVIKLLKQKTDLGNLIAWVLFFLSIKILSIT